MGSIRTHDGTNIHYQDWGAGNPIVLSHDWPLDGDAWEDQMRFLVARGFRCIAHDRRGHGLSSGAVGSMDVYADDLAALVDELDLRGVVLVGHGAGAAEIARYIGRHGGARVSRVVLVGTVTPYLHASENGSNALDRLRAEVVDDHARFCRELGALVLGAEGSRGLRDWLWMQSMRTGSKGVDDAIATFSQTNFTGDLVAFDAPTLVIHGEDDRIAPLRRAGYVTAELIRGSVFKIYPGAPHGLCWTHRQLLNEDLLRFASTKILPNLQAHGNGAS